MLNNFVETIVFYTTSWQCKNSLTHACILLISILIHYRDTSMAVRYILSLNWINSFFSAFNVHSPCGVFRDCSKLPDGHYPDTEQKCMRFYTCWKGSFLGFNACAMGKQTLNKSYRLTNIRYKHTIILKQDCYLHIFLRFTNRYTNRPPFCFNMHNYMYRVQN